MFFFGSFRKIVLKKGRKKDRERKGKEERGREREKNCDSHFGYVKTPI